MGWVENPRTVVTGAGSGLGRAFCVELARRGARIVACDIDEATARETAAMIPQSVSLVTRCDVSQRSEIEAFASKIEDTLGGVDLVINNAGVAVAGKIGQISDIDWQWIMGVNLWGPVHGCEVFLPMLERQGRGHILNVASLAGIASAANMGPYNVTKAGVIALSETLAAELTGTGVGVSVLCPSFFPTNIGKNARGGDPKLQNIVDRLMARSRFDANGIARIALDAVRADKLYVLPHTEAKLFWALERLMPSVVHRVNGKVVARVMRRG